MSVCMARRLNNTSQRRRRSPTHREVATVFKHAGQRLPLRVVFPETVDEIPTPRRVRPSPAQERIARRPTHGLLCERRVERNRSLSQCVNIWGDGIDSSVRSNVSSQIIHDDVQHVSWLLLNSCGSSSSSSSRSNHCANCTQQGGTHHCGMLMTTTVMMVLVMHRAFKFVRLSVPVCRANDVPAPYLVQMGWLIHVHVLLSCQHNKSINRCGQVADFLLHLTGGNGAHCDQLYHGTRVPHIVLTRHRFAFSFFRKV